MTDPGKLWWERKKVFPRYAFSSTTVGRKSYLYRYAVMYISQDDATHWIYRRSYHYTDSLVTIPKHNSLTRVYVNSNDASQSALFSYRLSEGSERENGASTVRILLKEFTGLHEGKYVFSVKLMTDKDQELVMTSFSFEILPPWYRTWWSYSICSRCGFTTILYSLSHS